MALPDQLQIDHIQALHRGGADDDDNLQALCIACHRAKTAAEAAGFGQRYPEWIPRPPCRVTLIVGPPCGGKTTYARHAAQPGDFVIDLDEVVQGLTGRHGHDIPDWGQDLIARAYYARNAMLAALTADVGHCWFILGTPDRAEWEWWRAKLGAAIVAVNPGRDVCLSRAGERALAALQRSKIVAWFAAPQPKPVKRTPKVTPAPGW